MLWTYFNFILVKKWYTSQGLIKRGMQWAHGEETSCSEKCDAHASTTVRRQRDTRGRQPHTQNGVGSWWGSPEIGAAGPAFLFLSSRCEEGGDGSVNDVTKWVPATCGRHVGPSAYSSLGTLQRDNIELDRIKRSYLANSKFILILFY